MAVPSAAVCSNNGPLDGRRFCPWDFAPNTAAYNGVALLTGRPTRREPSGAHTAVVWFPSHERSNGPTWASVLPPMNGTIRSIPRRSLTRLTQSSSLNPQKASALLKPGYNRPHAAAFCRLSVFPCLVSADQDTCHPHNSTSPSPPHCALGRTHCSKSWPHAPRGTSRVSAVGAAAWAMARGGEGEIKHATERPGKVTDYRQV